VYLDGLSRAYLKHCRLIAGIGERCMVSPRLYRLAAASDMSRPRRSKARATETYWEGNSPIEKTDKREVFPVAPSPTTTNLRLI